MEISLQYKLENTREISERILKNLAQVKLILFHGVIGSGKTTLIKVICKGLLIEEEISSPTFSIVNEYRNIKGEVILFESNSGTGVAFTLWKDLINQRWYDVVEK